MAIWDHVYSAPHMKAREPWIKKWKEGGLLISQGLYQEIANGAAKAPNTPLVFGSTVRPAVTNTTAMLESARRIADGLHALGLKAGDVLIFQMPNWAESMAAYIATVKIGVILVPVVHIYGASELSYILRATRAKALMLPDRWRNINYAARVEALGDLPDLEHVIVFGDGPMPGSVVRWPKLLEAPKDSAPMHVPQPHDIAMMNFTSGTTSDPKGALHSHSTLAVEGRFGLAKNPAFNRARGDIAFWASPGGHIAAIVSALRPFLLAEGGAYLDQFEGPVMLDILARHNIRYFGGAPYTINHLFDFAPEEHVKRLTAIGCGGAGVPGKLIHRAVEFGVSMVRSYGSTEHPTISSSEHNDPLEKRASTDGRLLTGTQVRLVNEDGKEAAPGETGEIVSIGPELFLGYLDPALNKTSFASDGWFHTGDIGVLDKDGFLTIVDRKKDIIIRGGENISSQEVEDVLARHPSIIEAAVVAWPDEIYGERVGAFVQLRPGMIVDIPSIGEHFKAAGLARQKTPERLVIVDDFPRTPYGKVLKRELRERISKETALA